jgi:uncharacterized membrane protein
MLFRQKYWHKLFEASVFIKAINGIWETVSGFVLLFISKATIAHAFYGLTKQELGEDHHDKVINVLNRSMEHLTSGTKNFAAMYILVHGLINIFLAYYLYKEKLWAFWVSLGFFGLSIVYLAYRAYNNHSMGLYALILFDVFFLFLTWHEFQYRKKLVALRLIPAE